MSVIQKFIYLLAGMALLKTLTIPVYSMEELAWTPLPVDSNDAIRDLTSDGQRIVRIIEVSNGASWLVTGYRIETSTDGVTWIAYEVTGFDNGREANVHYADGTWFAKVGGLRFTSEDGTNWTETSTILPDAEAEVPRHWIFANGWHVHAAKTTYGLSTTDMTSRLRSQDGNEWLRIEQDFGNAGTESFGAGQFVVLSQNTRYTSSDGETWTTAPVSGLPDDPGDLVYFRGRWLCRTANGEGGTLYVSEDACQWHAIQSWTGSLRLLHHPQLDRLFLVEYLLIWGWGGNTQYYNYFSSSDGIRWMKIGRRFPGYNHMAGPVALPDRLYSVGSTTQLLNTGNPTRFGLLRPGVLEWPASADMEYLAECSPDLSIDSWKAIGEWRTSAPGASALFLIQNPANLTPKQFYRILSRPTSD